VLYSEPGQYASLRDSVV